MSDNPKNKVLRALHREVIEGRSPLYLFPPTALAASVAWPLMDTPTPPLLRGMWEGRILRAKP